MGRSGFRDSLITLSCHQENGGMHHRQLKTAASLAEPALWPRLQQDQQPFTAVACLQVKAHTSVHKYPSSGPWCCPQQTLPYWFSFQRLIVLAGLCLCFGSQMQHRFHIEVHSLVKFKLQVHIVKQQNHTAQWMWHIVKVCLSSLGCSLWQLPMYHTAQIKSSLLFFPSVSAKQLLSLGLLNDA